MSEEYRKEGRHPSLKWGSRKRRASQTVCARHRRACQLTEGSSSLWQPHPGRVQAEPNFLRMKKAHMK